MADDPDSTSGTPVLEKVYSWLQKEGYPLEFRAANILRKHGFHARQGVYASAIEGTKREIDVLAETSFQTSSGLLRVVNIVECKWSGDKPWVIFTSPTTHLAAAACVSQSIGSMLGEAIMWTAAGLSDLHSLQLFSTPPEGGFGGRQTFSKGTDHFYSAIQSAVDNCTADMRRYDERHSDGTMPDIGAVAFPVVLVEGQIIRARYDANADDMILETVPHVRCHWRGSTAFGFIATVDVVAMDHFDNFAETRSNDVMRLLEVMLATHSRIERYSVSGSRADLGLTPGSRGVIGPPRLLAEIARKHAQSAGKDDTDG